MPLPGCLMHVIPHPDALAWISRILRCVDGGQTPDPRHFRQFHATIQVQTFDDIDQCMKIANVVLELAPEAMIGLRELIVNAVEHGNLEIDFDLKSDLLCQGKWQDEIERRLASVEYRDRFSSVELRRDGAQFTIRIADQGLGFDWHTHLDPDKAPTHMLHGRGISLANRAGFDGFEYEGAGNQVIVWGACGPDRTG
jgi:anti-sigma regulatory factor (Ser/Thr protein kinase)